MKTRKKKISKLERIPKLGSPARDIILGMLLEMPDYIDATKKWSNYFTKEDLVDIEEKYIEGMTWEDIESVLSSKGTILKHTTFRKYIQNGLIPKASSYNTTDKGRVAIYGSDIIMHLNFVYYFYNVIDESKIDSLLKIIGGCEISYKDAIESVLGGSGYLTVELVREVTLGDSELSDAIHNVLAIRDDKSKVLSMLESIQKKYEKYIAKDISEFEEYLTSQKMLVTQIPNDNSK